MGEKNGKMQILWVNNGSQSILLVGEGRWKAGSRGLCPASGVKVPSLFPKAA